ncbi:MAG TPA: PKD domain-containing protein, partial [Hadesarchaea archaeon]|nr:PKD domain-containing protein [Hadesarchaea archaeon]
MGRNCHEMLEEETSVSAVIAVILLLGLTFAAAAVVGVFLSTFSSAPPPDASFTSRVWIRENENMVWLELTHEGGKPLNIQELKVRLEIWDNEGSSTVLDSETPDGYTVSMSVRKGGTILRAGEVLDVEFTLSQTPNAVDSSVSVVHIPSGLAAFWIPRSMVFSYVPTAPTPSPQPSPPQPGPFVASFSFSPYLLATLDDEVRFWDESIGSIASWDWDFGDGDNSTAQNPTHQYTENGTYTVRLEVTADNGDKDNFSRIVQVVPPSHVELRDGKLFVDNELFTVKGVSYSPTPVGASAGAGYIWWGDSETYLNDFPMLREMGANTIRTYNAGALVLPPPGGYGIYSDGGLGENVNDPWWYDGGDGSPNGPPWVTTQSEVFGDGSPEDSEKSWEFVYNHASGVWGGVYTTWRHGGIQDMSAYENLVFWVKGKSGGENFEIVVEDNIGAGGKVPITDYVTVTTGWQEVSIPLSDFGEDLTQIKTPWNIVFSSGVTGEDATVKVDFIRWVGPGDEEPTGPLETKIYATKSALDYAYLNNLRVIMGFWVPPMKLDNTAVRENLKAGFVELVQRYRSHPAVLAWSFGNEVDYWYAGLENNWYTLLQEAALAAKAVDNNHPIITVNQEIDEIGRADNCARDSDLTALDIWGTDIYRGKSFGSLFSEYSSKSGKPLLLAEWGADALDARGPVEDQVMQNTYIRQQWQEIWMNLSHVGLDTQCIGGTVFEWSDEWWKAGAWEVQDTTGQWPNDAYIYDFIDWGTPNMNEDWWGITSVSVGTYEKTPKLAYGTLK